MNITINKRAIAIAAIVVMLLTSAIIFFMLWPPVVLLYLALVVGWAVYFVVDNPSQV